MASLALVRGDEIDNGVVGTPHIDCQENYVDFNVQTEKPFVGRIYAEGFQGRSGCAIQAFTPMGTNVSLRLSTQDCGMQNQRMTEPIRGMAFTVSLIVSFHGVFITKVDRAYKLQCYHEQEQAKVTKGIEISALPFTELTGVDKRRQCTYTVHSQSQNGPIATHAAVGDQLYHKWECNDKSKGIHIHSCAATDGRGKKFDFYDDRGCTVDGVIMPEVVYSPDRRSAHVETHAFKFSDIGTLNLECLVSQCNGTCEGIVPPNCGGQRVKRSNADGITLRSLPQGTFDTITRLKIFDLFDEEGRIRWNVNQATVGGGRSEESGRGECLELGSWALLLGLAFFLACAATLSTCLLLRNPSSPLPFNF